MAGLRSPWWFRHELLTGSADCRGLGVPCGAAARFSSLRQDIARAPERNHQGIPGGERVQAERGVRRHTGCMTVAAGCS